MASDRDLVSTEDHELNYLLKKWNKKQSIKNREILIEKLKNFKKDTDYKPHNRENFYRYVDNFKIKRLLEDKITDLQNKDKINENNEQESTLTIVEMPDSPAPVPSTPGNKNIKTEKTKINTGATITGEAHKPKPGEPEKKNKIIPVILIISGIILLICIILCLLFFINKCTKTQPGFNTNQIDNNDTGNSDADNTITREKELELKHEKDLNQFIKIVNENIPVYFVRDKAILLEGENKKLDIIIKNMENAKKCSITITGHTADVGEPENEKKLGEKRALMIKDYIESNSSVTNLVIDIKSYGSEELIHTNTKDENLIKKNRRIEIIVIDFVLE